jgi:hypothetical protein
MNRREAIGLAGMAATGFLAASTGDCAEDHHAAHGGLSHSTPMDGIHLYLCGVHLVKENPKIQVVTHHYCSAHGEVHQCLLYDTTDKNARLIGVEYIISDERYRALPAEEKKYWHPHTYEVMSGILVAPKMRPEEETGLVKSLLPTWGKTWQTWPDLAMDIPMGTPLLMWAVTGDGQLSDQTIERLEKDCRVSVAKIREARKQSLDYPVPCVDQPGCIEFVGRQWTNDGPDTPGALRKEKNIIR